MTPARYQRLKSLFLEASDLPESERSEFLARSCEGDAELRTAIAAQLAQATIRSPLDAPGLRAELERALAETDGVEPTPALPRRIGLYRIIRMLGQGGMGAVFEAEQESPRRSVAVKIIRPGLFDPDASRRLAREADLLAHLHHPGIAQVYQAGVAELETRQGLRSEQSFVAMELVSGETLDRYLSRTRPSMRERIELLAAVCDPVAHAHARGVVHRDLKPANIMVLPPEPDATGGWSIKILDFGIGCLLDPGAANQTVTSAGIGTPAYMSPERATPLETRPDASTDVYALGVTLFEALVGQRPPPPPAGAPGHRPAGPRSIDPSVPRPVDAIVAKALSRDPGARYATALEMAADLRRFLHGQPVLARPPSAVERGVWFIRRHPGAVWLLSAFVVLLAGAVLAGLAAVLIVFVVATAACAVLAVRAARDRSRAEAGERAATLERNQLVAVLEFTQEMLAAADPSRRAEPREPTVREMLDRAGASLSQGALAHQPAVELTVRTTVGRAYTALGLGDRAEEHLLVAVDAGRRAFPGGHVDLAMALNKLGVAHHERGRLEQSERYFRESLEMYRRLLGDEHERTATLFGNLGWLLHRRGRCAEGIDLLERALDLRRRIPDTNPSASVASTLNNLAGALRSGGALRRAESLYRESLAMDRERRGEDHPNIATTMSNLGATLSELDNHGEAAALARQALEMARRLLGPEHPKTLGITGVLGMVLHAAGHLEDAHRYLDEAAAQQSRLHPSDNVLHATLLTFRGMVLASRACPAEAQSDLREALASCREQDGDENQSTCLALEHLARVLASLGLHREGADVGLECRELARRIYPVGHWRAALVDEALALNLAPLGESTRAAALLADALGSLREHLGPDHAHTRRVAVACRSSPTAAH